MFSITIEVWKSGEKREVVFERYIQVTAPSDRIEQNSGCICVRLFTSEEIYHCICGKELESDSVNVGKW